MSASDLAERLARLPQEKRTLLFQQLQKSKRPAAEEATIPRRPRDGAPVPLSFAQQRLWFLNQYDPESPEYNIPQSLRIGGPLEAELLRRALLGIVERHEVLRTTFSSVEGDPVQVIAPRADFELPVIDLRGRPAAERQAEAVRQAGDDSRRPFDLERGPLLRAILYRLGDAEHLLYYNAHHVVWDDWSQAVFLRELRAGYEALAAGGEADLPELEIQYADFAVWQRQWLSGEVLDTQLDYWRHQLAGVPALELASDRPRPAVRTPAGAVHPAAFAPEVTRALRGLAAAESATLFMVLSAAFRGLLFLSSGQRVFAIGTLIANRTRPEIEPLIGFFTNTLVLRTPLPRRITFRELVRRERETALGAYGHQDLPFEKLVDELQPERDLSRTPLFQVMLILHNAPGKSHDLPGLRLEPVPVDNRTAKFDVTLYLTEHGDGVVGFFEYNTDLFDAATVERLGRHLRELTATLAADPDQRLEDLSLLSEGERRRILEDWNATRAELPEAPLHRLFEARAAARPRADAVLFEGRRLTYGELNARANRCARHLAGLGVGPETLVGVFVERSPDMVVAVLAVLKAGGAYLPLDPEYPEERIAYMLADGGAPVVLTQASLLGKLPEGERHAVCLDRDRDAIAAHDAGDLATAAAPDQLAYVIYTSGSTGRPKGVQISHRAVVNFLTSMSRRPGMTVDDRLLAVTTLSFDIAGLELYLPLLAGAELELASREVAAAGEELLARLRDFAPTVMQATPATWRLLVDAGWQGDPKLKILCGGEALPPSLAADLVARCGELWNVYGPTEATIWSTLQPVVKADGQRPVSIGRPLANTDVYVLGPGFQPTPAGVPGELLIGGAGLTRGYRGRPRLTAEKLVPHPFAARQGERLYRTGDLARYRDDGTLEFLGRIDHQVKLRGFRIELGEIEAVLSAHAEISQAVALVREDRPGDRRLVGYFVAADGAEPDVDALAAALKEKLPEYMVPSLFVPMDELPLTPNGKVDRKALPAPDPAAMTAEYVAPRDGTEDALAEIWASILGLERVGIEDDFFKLGGDSLMVVRVVARAKKRGLSLTTKQVFLHRVLRELAAAVGTVEILAEQGPVTGPLPMTPAQHHFLEVGHDRPEVHSLGFLLEAERPIPTEVVTEAVRAIVHHHDSLRVRMVTSPAGAPALVIDEPSGCADVMTIDLSALPEDRHLRTLGRAGFQMARSFDFYEGRLFRAMIFDRGGGAARLVFLVGQFMAADIGSYQVILEDFDAACGQLLRGERPRLPAKTTSAAQWATRLVERAGSDDMKEDLDYFLDDARQRAARIPLDFDRGPNTYRSARVHPIRFNREESDFLRQELPRALGVQIDAVLLTAVAYALEPLTGARSLLVSSLGHGREPLYDDVDLTRTVGWFNTIYPALLDLGDAPDPLAALPRINRQLRRIPHGGIGYGIARYLSTDPEVRRKLAAQPEAQVFLNYFGPDTFEMSLYKKVEDFKGYLLDFGARRLCPITIGGYVDDGELLMKWEYSTHLLRESTVEPVFRRCEEVLRWLLRNGRHAESGARPPWPEPVTA